MLGGIDPHVCHPDREFPTQFDAGNGACGLGAADGSRGLSALSACSHKPSCLTYCAFISGSAKNGMIAAKGRGRLVSIALGFRARTACRSRPPSPVATQHSLPSGRYSLLGPDFHRPDRTSLRLAHLFDHLVGAVLPINPAINVMCQKGGPRGSRRL